MHVWMYVDRLLYEFVSLECRCGNGERFPVIHVDLKVTCERGMLFSEPDCTEMYSGWVNGVKFCSNVREGSNQLFVNRNHC